MRKEILCVYSLCELRQKNVFFVFQHVIKTMSRTTRSIKNINPNARRVGNKLKTNKTIEENRDLGLTSKKPEKFAPDDFTVSSWKEKVHLKWELEKDGSNTYTLHGRFLVNLTPEEEKGFNFLQFFGEYAEHLI